MAEFGEVLRDVWSDRARLGLVVLALAWGTLGLTVLAGFGAGFDHAMRVAVARSGERMLRLDGGATTRPAEGFPAGRPVHLGLADADAIRRVPGVRRVSVEHGASLRLEVDGVQINANVRGVEASFGAIRRFEIRAGGRFLSAPDVAERKRVAVLGQDLARSAFGGADPLGRTIGLGGAPHRVVGVLEKHPTVMNYDGEDPWKVFVPDTTLRAHTGARIPEYVIVELDDPAQSFAVGSAIRAVLARRLRFDPADRSAIGVRDHAAQAAEIVQLVAGTRLFLLIVGVLGLLVSAIGIANSTIALVEERIAEIGLRMALGATRRQIMARPLLESAALVLLGGGVGILAATLLLAGLAALPLDPNARGYIGSPIPTPAIALGVVGILGLTAAFAGIAPARRAASVDPVDALRHE